jgi:hypothetical protein
VGIIIFALAFTLYEREREFKLIKFVKDVNANIFTILKTVIRLMIMEHAPPARKRNDSTW